MKKIWTVLAAAVLILTACETTAEDYFAELDRINTERSETGVPVLTGNLELAAEADEWSQHMRDTCTIAHRPDMTAGVPEGWTMVAENVGYGPTVEDVFQAFLDSPGHERNINDARLTHVGVAIVYGDCWGWSNVWVTQIFMRYG